MQADLLIDLDNLIVLTLVNVLPVLKNIFFFTVDNGAAWSTIIPALAYPYEIKRSNNKYLNNFDWF